MIRTLGCSPLSGLDAVGVGLDLTYCASGSISNVVKSEQVIISPGMTPCLDQIKGIDI